VHNGATIRSCCASEIRQVLELWRAAGVVPSATDDEISLRGLLEHCDQSALVAEVDRMLVGTLIVAWDGWRGHLYHLAVLPHYRRRGIARQLVAIGEQRLREWGAQRVGANVMLDNEAATNFWTALGYRQDNRVARVVKPLR
jgi:ribosomal protein S18 acetylase RimI-like enzyme